jgi:hypothetical protein
MLPKLSASSVTTHLYARSKEAIITEEVAASAQSVAQGRPATFATIIARDCVGLEEQEFGIEELTVRLRGTTKAM